MVRRAEGKPRAAFSLLEIILVLAILVAISAIVAPSVGDAVLRQRLDGAVNRLRSEWDRARLTAMKTGQTQVFTCALAAREYSIEPYMSEADVLNASAGATVVTTGGTVAQATSDGTLTAAQTGSGTAKQLDEDITFVSCAVSGDMRAMSVAQAQGGLAAMSTASQMVLFYPDGSTSTAEVIIQNANGTQRAVRMRGLTGSTQVLTPGELPAVVSPLPGAQ